MNSSDPTSLIIAAVYYILVSILSFFAIFGIYILIRYGKSSILTLIGSLLFAFFYIKILADSYAMLKGLS